MARFLIYLFESGLCLSLFYLGYIVFFRKETYFTFNRFYLLGSMILALTIPLISLPINIGDEGYIKETANGVVQFRNYYEHLILLTDPEFAVGDAINASPDQFKALSDKGMKASVISLSSIILIIYTLGVLFFSFRLIYLLSGLKKIIAKAKVSKDKEANLVLINDEVPPFSFMKWIFVNPNLLKPEEYEQVLTHEKVHVQHKHSVDLILAHVITIFQWFNPLTWRIQKSIKTCHEYIADRQVVQKGHELFDYQSLLLSQLISIRSVELVNNFNLLSIKKRIAMMNKNKSGRLAQLKALAIVPLLLAAFFLFTDMTSRNPKLNYENIVATEGNTLLGHWMAAKTGTDIVQFIEIKSDKMVAIITKGNNNIIINDYSLSVRKDQLILSIGDEKRKVNYSFENDVLTIDWDKEGKHRYTRDKEKSIYILLNDQFQKLSLPFASQLKPYKKEMILCSISLSDGKLFVNENDCSFDQLESRMIKIRSSADQSKVNKMSVLLNIDKDAKMEHVDQIKTALRKSNNLKLGYLARLKGHIGTDYMALFNLLPPMDAKWMEKDELKNEGIALFEIGKTYKDFSNKLEKHINSHKKYVMLYEYDNATSYDDYIQTIDMVHRTINSLREAAASKDGKNYSELDYNGQKVYRKMYPITLTMKNADEK